MTYRFLPCVRGFLFVLLTAPGASIHAQTQFHWPSSNRLDVTEYTTVDDCLAIATRVRDSIRDRAPDWPDTLPLDRGEIARPLPSMVVDIAQRCSARFKANDIPIVDATPMMTLYLMANRDDDAQTILRRRLQAIPDTAVSIKAAILDSVAKLYLQARPARMTAVDSIAQQFIKLGKAIPWPQRWSLFSSILDAAHTAGDTMRIRQSGEQLLAIADGLTEAEKRSPEWTGSGKGAGVVMVRMVVERQRMLDSLRKGSAAFAALQQSYMSESLKKYGFSLPWPFGKQAAKIESDFWYPPTAQKNQYPRLGKISLIMFVGEGRSLPNTAEHMAALRRLKQRFPNLDILLVGYTRGWFFGAVPPTPEEEGELIRKYLLDFYRIPATLTVAKTSFWRLPGYDRRRIDDDVPFEKAYGFVPNQKLVPGATWVVDETGTVVDYRSLNRKTEPGYIEIFDILFSRTQVR
jgi:hypothetical protein